MAQDDLPSMPIEQASPLVQGLLVLGLGVFGSGMVAQGLGWHGLDFLRPHPSVPPGVFAAVGCFLILAALIVALKASGAPRWMSDLAGWSALAAGFGLMNWLIFYSGGHAACFIGPVPSLVLGVYGSMACDWLGRAIVVFCDCIAVLIAVTAGLKRIGPRLPV